MTERQIFLIRHGQSAFNAAYGATGVDPMLFDAPLTDKGHAQVEAARQTMRSHAVELVLASPLTRALQTALGIFAGHPSQPRLVVDAAHRERLESSCDQGRVTSLLRRDFPTIGFDDLAETWWHDEGEPDARGIHVEPLEVMMARLRSFADAMRERPERVVAVVGHATFFHHLTGRWMDNCEILAWDGRVAEPAA